MGKRCSQGPKTMQLQRGRKRKIRRKRGGRLVTRASQRSKSKQRNLAPTNPKRTLRRKALPLRARILFAISRVSKTRRRKKPASKKGSSKGKRNVKDEFADLPVVEGSVV